MSTVTKAVSPLMLGLALALSFGVLGGTAPASAHERRIAADYRGLALDGYDPVAYYVSGEAVKGSMDYEIITGGATWRFVSEENRNKFAENPERYIPRFGGYCAMAMTKAKARAGDPKIWAMVDGRVYLTESDKAMETWRKNPPQNIALGVKGWKTLMKRCKHITDLKNCEDAR